MSTADSSTAPPDKDVSSTAPPDKDVSSTAPPDNAVSSTAPPVTEIKPPAPQKKRWADEEDDPVEDSNPSSSTPALESIVEDLKIDENKKINKFLDEPEDSNIKAVITGETPYTSASSFEDLNLSPELLKGLYVEMKFQKPSKIQAISLPMILTPPYKDLIAQAHNGSGKTTCFVLGMLSRVDPNLKVPQALCICPTRELAIQNMEVLRKMGKHTGITSECAVPMDSTNYISISKRAPVSAQIVIGTPGTIKKWMSAKKLAVNNVRILVFDEADHMLAEVDGFKDDSLRIKKGIERSSRHCQVLLFSATFNETVKNFVAKIVKDYNQLFVKKEELSLASVKQYKVFCPDESGKIQISERFLEPGEHLGQRITLGPTEPSASKPHKQLVDDGSTSVRRGYKVADRVNHNDVLEKQRTNVDENSNWEKKLATVKKEPEDTLREVRKDVKRACPVEIEEIMKAHSTELEETKRVQSTKLEEARRAHSTELEETKRVHSTKLEEARRAHSIELEETSRVYSTKLEEARRAHSIELEEIRRVHSTKLEEARRAYATELEEARRGMEELKKKYEVARHMVGLRRGGHSW